MKAQGRAFTVPRAGAFAFRLAYVAVVVFATYSEASDTPDLARRLERALATEMTGRDVVDAVRNVLLFAGWGATWMITSPAGPAWPMVVRATASGALLSASVEAAQLVSPDRVASLLDLITNTAGSFMGALGLAALVLLARAGLGRRSYVGLPMLLFATGYGLATTLEAFSPFFRQARLTGSWGSPTERLGHAIAALAFGSFPFLEFLLFMPAGAFAVAALTETGAPYRGATSRVLGLGTLAYALAQIARGAAGYPIEVGPFLAHVLGFTVGAVLAARTIPVLTRELRGRMRPATLLVFYAVLFAGWTLRPFVPEIDLHAIADKLDIERFIPLMAYRERVDVFTAVDVAIPALQLLPVGALLAVWPVRRRGLLAGPLPAIYGAALFETMQIGVNGRLFDITDVLISAAAIALGWAVLRRAGFTPYGELLPAAAPGARHPPGTRQERNRT